MVENRALHEALLNLARQAGEYLDARVEAGEEIPYELATSGIKQRMYHYHPLTGQFLLENAANISALPAHRSVIDILGRCPDHRSYLQLHGTRSASTGPSESARTVIRVFLCKLWENATSFAVDPVAFEQCYKELERQLYRGPKSTRIVATIEGMTIEGDQFSIDDQITILAPGQLTGGPIEIASDELPTIMFRLDGGGEGNQALETAGHRLRSLSTALRLWDRSRPALGSIAWASIDSGGWRCFSLESGWHGGDDHCLLTRKEQANFSAFLSLIESRIPKRGELAWALKRFELGCRRPLLVDALTDFSLALHALLGDLDSHNPEVAARRLAQLCTTRDEVDAFAQATVELLANERQIISGVMRPAEHIQAAIYEFGDHLRAVIRDSLCGHLERDLRTQADRTMADLVVAAA